MASSPTKKIILVRLSHVFYTHVDPIKEQQFLLDFGLAEEKRVGDKIYYRGYGPDPFVYCSVRGDDDAFGGLAFVVESEEDLKYASETLPQASPVFDMSDAPGGGRCVSFKDPVDGFEIHLVHGQKLRESKEANESGDQLPTELKSFEAQVQLSPAPVYKLGHVGVCVTDFQQTFEFYTSHFNFLPSELIHKPDTGKIFNTFCRLHRGKELVDHHCFLFFEGPKYHVHHSSFETHDFDTQVLGHDWLRHKGWRNCWGVGRHIMGSQIFDYWFDASGFILEHYVDGDLVDNTHPTQKNAASADGIHVWGPDLPLGFLD